MSLTEGEQIQIRYEKEIPYCEGGEPREAMDVPSLEVLKASLDGALSNLVQWKEALLTVWGVELDDL